LREPQRCKPPTSPRRLCMRWPPCRGSGLMS
jgi:hypothetical protein